MSPAGAILRFHAASGGRLALRAAVPLAGALTLATGLAPSPEAFLGAVAGALAAFRPDAAVTTGYLAIAAALAAWAAPRIEAGSAGWIRHLPVTERQRLRASLLAVALAQAPLLVAGAAAIVGLGAIAGSWNVARLLALPVVGLGVALATLRVRRRLATGIAGVAAAGIAMTGGLASVSVGLLLVIVGERVAGGPGVRRPARARAPGSPRPFPLRVARRAIGAGTLFELLPTFVPVGAAALFVSNNDEPLPLEARIVRLGALLSATLAVAALAERLAARRPPWPWSRTLPWRAADRTRFDAALLGLAALPATALASLLDPLAALASLACLPLLALRGAGAMRRSGEGRSLAFYAIVLEGSLGAAAVALVPGLAIAALLLAPLADRGAARKERRLPATRWIALHHDEAGDPLSWGSR